MEPTSASRSFRLPTLPEDGGPWTCTQLGIKGIGYRQTQRLLRSGAIIRLRRGAYMSAERAHAATAVERARFILEAHIRAFANRGLEHVYSHTSAAAIHGIDVWPVQDRVHLIFRSRPSTGKVSPDVTPHYMVLPETDVELVAGSRVTTLERTAADCCCYLPLASGLIILDQALQAGADISELWRIAKARAGQRGVRNLRQALALADPKAESLAETRTRLLLWELNIAAPVSQFEVMTSTGRRRLDFAWPKLKVALEFDGRIKYFGDQPTDEALYQERIRERELMEQGWVFVRITWSDLSNPYGVKKRLLEAFARQSVRS